MIDEPYRWVEAIANRREYIETELATGSPTLGLSFSGGLILLTFGRDRKKLFEVYDRIALGGIGHPGDLERLRIMAIELASTEGFTRSATDVSLRRMVTFSFSPALKQAFEQIYGAPFLAKLLFAEVGRTPREDLFVALEYDGSMSASGMIPGKPHEPFGAITGTKRSHELVREFLGGCKFDTLESALEVAVRAWGVGMFTADEDHREIPTPDELKPFIGNLLGKYTIEAIQLEREPRTRAAFSEIPDSITEPILAQYRE
jgi:proteasome alpha subunit